MSRSQRSTRPARPGPELAPAPKLAPPSRGESTLLATLATVLALVLVTYPLYDKDLWQHLEVGRVIWAQHSIPRIHLWSWPTFGVPEVLPSWLFRALLYPFWAAGGELGVQVWRWVTTLAAFGLLFLGARAAGARGPWALPALLWCLVLYRFRSQARPETLVAILLAAQLWLLEKRRAAEAPPARLDPAWGVVPLALLWANAHISFFVGLLLTGIHLVAALAPGKPARKPPAPRTLFLVLLASLAASFVNPFGWRTLAQPFEYFLVWRHEPIYQVIGELRALDWGQHVGAMLPYWFLGVGLLAILRWIRHEFDLVQCLVLLVFVPQALTTQRFLGTLAALVAPFFARDLAWAVESLRFPFLARPVPRAGAVALALVAITAVAERASEMRPGLGFRWSEFPVRACDWIESHGVRGRGFNSFGDGGYMLWRFWPDRGRLPFMDIHQSGTRMDRDLTALALSDEASWRRLDAERRFDYVLLPSRQFEGQRLLDFLDADSLTWRLVFLDDAAVLYLRRQGPFADMAERERYRVLPAGDAAMAALAARPVADTAFTGELRRELERAIRASPWTSVAHNMLAQLARVEGKFDEAERETRAASAAARARPATVPRGSN